jgi:hypothetical protein
MSLVGGPRLWVGKLPTKDGVWLYELDCGVFRALAKFDGAASATRFLKFTSMPRPKDLKKGIPCEMEIEGYASEDRRGDMMQRRKPILDDCAE